MKRLGVMVLSLMLMGGGTAYAYDTTSDNYDWAATTTGARVEITGNHVNVHDTACDGRGATGKWQRTGHPDTLSWHNGQGCNTSSGYTTGGVIISAQACTTRPLQSDRCGGWVGSP